MPVCKQYDRATTDPISRSRTALDAVNFFLADVHGGLGPYLAVYLLTVREWREGQIGIVLSIAGIAGVLAQTPAGALVDATRAKRAMLVVAALIVTLTSLSLLFEASFLAVAASQAVVGMAGAVFGPGVAAISLGIVGQRPLASRIGRNEAFNHAGNATAAMLAGTGAYFCGPTVVFVLIAIMAIATIVSVLCIPAGAINHEVARGLEDGHREYPSGWRVLLTCRPLSVQALDGVGAGLYRALFPLIVADLTRGTGRFNVSQGAIGTAQGGALSAAVAGAWSRWPGIPPHSCCWRGLPAAGLALFWIAMAETRPADEAA